MIRMLIAGIIVLQLVGCTTLRPSNTENVCDIFQEKRSWFKKAKKAAKKWDSEVAIIMAFIRRESNFVANAKPPRTKILWVIPWFRASDAYGYAQVKNATWAWYEREEGGVFASRDDFGDAADFIGWYNKQSSKRCKISTHDAYNLYLAYHEGQGGYNRGTYKNKKAVKSYAQKVAARTHNYRAQLKQCEERLNKRHWLFF